MARTRERQAPHLVSITENGHTTTRWEFDPEDDVDEDEAKAAARPLQGEPSPPLPPLLRFEHRTHLDESRATPTDDAARALMGRLTTKAV